VDEREQMAGLRTMRQQTRRPVVTVQARRHSEDFWMVWAGHELAGSVHSVAELESLVRTVGARMDEVRYERGADHDLRQSGPLPPGRR
jgi:hypothetical protein